MESRHNYIIGPTDTDSISFCNRDGSEIPLDVRQSLLKELNEIMPELIVFEDDGYYKKCIVLKAKNYILYDPTKQKESDQKQIKGSAFKSAKKEPFLAQMMQDMVNSILNEKENELLGIYESYVDKALHVKTMEDLLRWSSKITITEAVLNCKGYEIYSDEELKIKKIRANETNVWDAVKREELIQQGDKVFLFPAILSQKLITTTKTLKSGKEKTTSKVEITYGLLLPKHWDGQNHDVQHLLDRLYKTISIFKNILDLTPFLNYSLVKNYKNLLDTRA